jgi:cell wall-associated NlpC family hydrolase
MAPPPDPKRASGLFAAAQPGKVAAAAPDPPKPGGASQLFMQAIKPEPAPAAPAAAPAPAAEPAAAAVDLSGVAGDYPGDDAPKEQIAAWMAKEAEKRGLPPQLPVMAALVESNLTNVNYGDADSLGYFQMRTSFWESKYPGFADDPKKQIDWFLDTAEGVKEQRVSRGQSITDPSQFGEWIADVERPAEQYRYRYQERLEQAEQLLKDAPKTAPPAAPEEAAPEQPAPGEAPPAVTQGAGPKALAALKEAEKYTGTPYKWGGSTPQTGFDCSGLVQWAYAQAGIQIPRVTHDQIEATNGTAVRRSELLPGDLVFFRDPSGYVYHVGISMGGDKFLHAPRTGDVVKVASLDEPYYNERFTGGRRFDEAAAAAPAAPAAPAAAPAQAPDPVAVAAAQSAVARDAAEARQPNSGLFKAISAQEARNHRDGGDRELASMTDEAVAERAEHDSALFLKAITAEQAAKAKAAADAARVAPAAPEAPAAPPEAAAPPAAPEVAATPEPVPAGPPPDLSAVPADYPGDDASQKELAQWLAKRAEKAGLPAELPVMAALVESDVKNLNYGHADSVGFFQMRTSIWNEGEYAGYPENPGLQAKWFIDTALAVKRQEIAAGNANFGKDPSAWGEWIADIERPAEQYRGRYQLRLAEARRLLR